MIAIKSAPFSFNIIPHTVSKHPTALSTCWHWLLADIWFFLGPNDKVSVRALRLTIEYRVSKFADNMAIAARNVLTLPSINFGPKPERVTGPRIEVSTKSLFRHKSTNKRHPRQKPKEFSPVQRHIKNPKDTPSKNQLIPRNTMGMMKDSFMPP